MDYWKDCITEAFEDAGITATEEQTNLVASWADGAHENYSMARGYDCIPSPAQEECKKLKSDLKEAREERDMPCVECAEKEERHRWRVNDLERELEAAQSAS